MLVTDITSGETGGTKTNSRGTAGLILSMEQRTEALLFELLITKRWSVSPVTIGYSGTGGTAIRQQTKHIWKKSVPFANISTALFLLNVQQNWNVQLVLKSPQRVTTISNLTYTILIARTTVHTHEWKSVQNIQITHRTHSPRTFVYRLWIFYMTSTVHDIQYSACRVSGVKIHF